MSLTRNLKLRLSNELTTDARYNLERIDQLGSVFPIGGSSQTIKSSGDIRLEANSSSLGGDGNGTVFAPNLQLSSGLSLESGAFTSRFITQTQVANITYTLPENSGTSGQFLQTNGTGLLSWEDPPTSNFATLNDTNFNSLQPNQVAQWNGFVWVNATLPGARQAGSFTWTPADGSTKTIIHNFNTSNIIVQGYDAVSKCAIFFDTIDYFDLNTIVLTVNDIPSNDYLIHLVQVS